MCVAAVQVCVGISIARRLCGSEMNIQVAGLLINQINSLLCMCASVCGERWLGWILRTLLRQSEDGESSTNVSVSRSGTISIRVALNAAIKMSSLRLWQALLPLFRCRKRL